MPTRAFAACFVALGIVASIIERTTKVNMAERFSKIRALPVGTPLIFISGKTKKKALFDGPDSFGGEPRIRIKFEGSSRAPITFLGPLEVDKLFITDIAEIKLPKNAQKGKEIDFNERFISGFLNEINITEFVLNSVLEVLIVGNSKLLTDELVNTEFAVKKGTDLFKGTLQDIVRVKRLNESYRADIFPTKTRRYKNEKKDQPKFVIFDGGLAFLKWRHLWSEAQIVVLLDRTEPVFEKAVSELNNMYIHNRVDDAPQIQLPRPTLGVELVTFRE
ncbi:hypothetical protein ACOBQJ_12940 [Pelotomaculum propionicicum]